MIKFLLILCLSISPAFAADNSLEKAKKAMQSGNYASALETLRVLVGEEENNYEAWFLFGVAQVHEQKDHQAIEAFRHVISLRPKLAEPHNNLAAVYNNLGDTSAAIKELEIALEKRPNYAVAEENLADLHIKLALQYYRNSLSHGANEAVSQRYARLLRVRNPVVNTEDATAVADMEPPASTAPDESVKAKPLPKASPVIIMPESAGSPVADDTYAQAKVEKITSQPTPSIAEDKSITGVLDALEAWRVAWSSQNLDAYFSSYAETFDPGSRFSSIEAWKAYKTRVIKNKSFINVQLDKVEVDIPASRDVATISVLQHFKSNTYVGNDRKQITMKYTPQGWKIITEVSLP